MTGGWDAYRAWLLDLPDPLRDIYFLCEDRGYHDDQAVAVGADGTLTGKVTVRGNGVFETGYLTGALYGATGDELAFVLYSSGESGSVLGGVVAGQE